MIIDTHTHLYVEEFNEDRNEMISRATAAGIQKFLLPNIDSTSIESMLEMEKNFPNQAYPMMGLHPCSVKSNYIEELNIVERYLADRDFIGIGEIGLDMYWDQSTIEIQKEVFVKHLQWAKQKKRPVSIHTRECTSLAIGIVEKNQDNDLKGVFHCFGGSVEEARHIIAMDMYLGIGGVLTYKNSNLKDVLKEIGYDHLVIETDAPYLSPVPKRGKRNEPENLHYVIDFLCQLFTKSKEEMIEILLQNTKKVFQLDN